ncbi:MAG: PKD domain-containing protein, partial [Bacteroidota bacterium]|nr:PKD domain-containing protein [Bacteroidota bacterium]
LSVVTLAGSGGDIDGTVTGYRWTKISGPATFNIVNSVSPITDISGLVAGVYNFELNVTDNNGAIGKDTIQVTVNSIANMPPTANAGNDMTIITPASIASLAGTAVDPDGSITAYSWSVISAPSTCSFVNPSSPVTDVTGLGLGVYTFQFMVTDNSGAVAKDTIQVAVIVPPNMPPSSFAGLDQVIILPKNTTRLSGIGSDPDGTVVSYSWIKIAGPAAGIITAPNSPVTSITGMVQGSYAFALVVTDNQGAQAIDTMVVSVGTSSLPLNLLSFSGSVQNQQVSLLWQTTNETNMKGFDIERMSDSSWNKIGFVPVSALQAATNYYRLNDLDPLKGLNYYRLKIIDIDGKFVYSNIISFELWPAQNQAYQNFPNPFSTGTNIKYEISEKAPVRILIYNAIGIKVDELVNEVKSPGVYQVDWNASNAAPGNYYYKVIIGEKNAGTTKMIKLR